MDEQSMFLYLCVYMTVTFYRMSYIGHNRDPMVLIG